MIYFELVAFAFTLTGGLIFINEAQTLEGNTSFHWLMALIGFACCLHYAKELINRIGFKEYDDSKK